MRTDLTANFLAKASSDYREPIQLLAIHFATGVVWASDRVIDLTEEIQTIALVESWGELTTVGESDDRTSGTRELTLVLWNGGNPPFSTNFARENPINVFVDLYQTFEDLDFEDKALIDTFVIQEPIEYNEYSRLLNLDLVSINMKYTGTVGKQLSKSDFPFAFSQHVNKGIDLIIGSPGTVQTLYAKAPLIATQRGTILKLPTILNTVEDISEFPLFGYLELEQEIVYYSTRDEDTFTLTERGCFGTTVSEHSDGTQILEYIDDHTFIVGQGPLSEINNVKAGGLLLDPSEYSVDLVSDPATIIFERAPKTIVYARGARNLDLDFDLVSPSNNAQFPHYSFDPEFKAFGAVITRSFSPLAIRQIDESEDIGEVVRAFLFVEHWATKFYNNDYISVSVAGIGEVGRLSRPSELDDFTFDAEVDIDHGHSHVTGQPHNHPFDNPGIGENDPGHPHGTTAATSQVTDIAEGWSYFDMGEWYVWEYTSWRTDYLSVAIYNPVNEMRVRFNIEYYIAGYVTPDIEITYRRTDGVNRVLSILGVGEVTLNGTGALESFGLRWRSTSSSGAIRFRVLQMEVLYIIPNQVQSATTSLNAFISSSGSVNERINDTAGIPLKATDDVNSLSAENRRIIALSQTNPTRTVIDKFDLTQFLESIDWEWFTNKDITLSYVGNNDSDVNIIVPYVNFNVEYLQRSVVRTTDITCEPIGTIENRPDMVIQYLLNQKSGLPFDKMGSVGLITELWIDSEDWIDSDIWLDSGEVVGEVPAGAYFERAAIRFDFLGYEIDGVISANKTVREALIDLCFQSRSCLVWDRGKILLDVQEKSSDIIFSNGFVPSDLQFKSIFVDLGRVSEINNKITLKYDFQLEDYTKNIVVEDVDSVLKHGEKFNSDLWNFYLIRNDEVATDLANYYLWKYGLPNAEYSFKGYLNNFSFEKRDAITLTSALFWDKISKLPLVIKDVKRVFGSGKISQINTIEFVGTSIRTGKQFEDLTDQIFVSDQIVIDSSFDFSIIDSLIIDDSNLLFINEFEIGESITVNDSISFEWELTNNLSDSITTSETLRFVQSLLTGETLNIDDSIINIFVGQGFGVSPFGSNFGSVEALVSGLLSSISIEDTIEVTLT